MNVRLLAAATRREQPWRNGAGVTWEVARGPADAGDDAYAWRVSIARLRGTSTFSSFPGIDRTLQMLQGTVDLTIAGVSRRLSRDTGAVAFAGEDAVACSVVGAASEDARDLNVLVRRTSGLRSSIERLVADSVPRTVEVGTTLVVALDALAIRIDDAVHALEPLDALHVELTSPRTFAVHGPSGACACMVHLIRNEAA